MKFPKQFDFYQIKFSQLGTISKNFVDVVIFDLGLSSIQLDDLERGFSFKSDRKLNMTMGLNEITALEAVKRAADSLDSVLFNGLENTMNTFNS